MSYSVNSQGIIEFDIERQIALFSICISPTLTVLKQVFWRREEISRKPHGNSANCYGVSKH